MKAIPLERVKKDNSNIRGFNDRLWRELRKERFRKPQHEKYISYCISAGKTSFNPYNDLNTTLDIEEFKNQLSEIEKECFEYFLVGMIQEEIAIMMGNSQGRVSQILTKVVEKFKEFYKEDDNA